MRPGKGFPTSRWDLATRDCTASVSYIHCPERPSQKTTFVHTVHSGVRQFQNLTSSVASEMRRFRRRQIFCFWSTPLSPTRDVCLPANGRWRFTKGRAGSTLEGCRQNRHNEYWWQTALVIHFQRSLPKTTFLHKLFGRKCFR